jgi:hypothetical protein
LLYPIESGTAMGVKIPETGLRRRLLWHVRRRVRRRVRRACAARVSAVCAQRLLPCLLSPAMPIHLPIRVANPSRGIGGASEWRIRVAGEQADRSREWLSACATCGTALSALTRVHSRWTTRRSGTAGGRSRRAWCAPTARPCSAASRSVLPPPVPPDACPVPPRPGQPIAPSCPAPPPAPGPAAADAPA